MDIQNIDFERILKWALIVLITGFIAQFGKSFAKYVMEKIRLRRTAEKSEQEAGDRMAPQLPTLPSGRESAAIGKPETVTPGAGSEEKDQAKLQKKALKAQVKQQKKIAKKP